MKKKFLLSLLFLFFVSLVFAQAPAKFTYQAVVRDATNHLVVNSPVGMRISILQGGVNGTVLYVETHNAVTNSNGLVTVVIGSGNLLQGSITAIDWSEGPMFLLTETDPNGGTNYTITSTQQLLSVPYALYAGEAANGFSGDYNDLSNLPQIPQIPANVSYFTNDAGYITMDSIPSIPTVPTNVSAFTNDAGYIAGYTETDPQFNAWDKDYNDLTNKPVLFNGDYNSLTNQPQIPTVPTNVSAFTNDAGYLTGYTETDPQFNAWDKDYNDLTNKPTLFSGNYNDLTNKPSLFSGNYNDLTNKPSLFSGNYNDLSNKPVLFDWDYYSLNNRPTIPTVPTNVSAFTNDAGYITGYTETDPLFSAWDKNYNDLTNKPTLFDGNYNSLSNKPSLFSGNYNDLTNKPVIPTVPTNVSAFTNDVPYLTAEQQVLSIRHDTIFLTGGSFVKLPESLTEDQVSQMIHQCCSSMQLYVDSVVTTRVNNLLSQQLTDAFKHYLDSLAEAMAQTYIDSVNVPCPIVSHDSVFPANPCPEAPYVLDWDGNVYNTVKIGSQCWMQENLRSWHFSDGTIIPSTTISYYYNEGPYGPNRIKPDNNIDNVATYGYLYNYEAVFRTNDTSILNNSIPSGVQGICPNGWHIPSMAEWQQLVDYMGNYSMYICDDQTYNVAKALAAQTGWRDDCSNLCAIGTDLSANNASGFSALPAGEAWGNDPHYFGDRAYFWSATQSTHNLNEAKIIKMDYPQANCDLDYYCGLTGAMSVRCLRDPGAPTPPCPPVSVTISGETQICSGSSTTLTAAGAQTYVWSNGQSASSITVNSTGTYSVTGTDANGCKGTASVNVAAHVPQHESLNVTTCSSYTWHGQIYTSGGTYTYTHTDSYGCTQVDTLRLTMDDCASVVTGNISYVTPTSAVVTGNATSYGGTSIIARGICWGQTSYPTILSDNYTNDGTGSGDIYGVLTGLTPNTNYHVRAYATTNSGTSYGEVITFYTIPMPSDDAIPCPGHETVTDYDGNTYNTVKIGQQCWMKENLKTQHYADGTVIPIGMVGSTTTAYRYHPNNNSDNLDMYGYLYNWPAVMHGETSSSNNPSGVQGICPTGWHMPSDAEWTQLTDYLKSTPAYGCIGDNEQIAKALSANEGWPVCSYYGTPGHYPILNNISGFSAKPAGYYGGISNTYGSIQAEARFWTATESWYRAIRFSGDKVDRSGESKNYGLSVRCVLGSGSTPTAITPSVTSGTVSNITSSTATVSGNVTADGGATVTARGVCWSTSPNPTVNGSHTADGTGTGSFTSTLTGLTPNTTYYVRAYATNAQGTSYGNELSFTTVCSSMSVTISGNTSICAGSNTTLTAVGAQTYAWSNGQSGSSITVNSAGTYAVTGTNANGCSGSASVSVSVNPSTEHTETVTACGSYTWVRPDGSSQILYQSGTYTYPYVNAYGCSSMETLILALTPCATTPAVHISDMTNVTTTSAVVNAEVASDGGATVTSRGICWGLSPLPTIDGPHTTEGGGVGTFSSTLTGLTPGTTYFVQAYAINSVGIAYSNSTEWFTTLCGAPTDLAVSNITMSSATVSWSSGSGTMYQELEIKRQSDSEWWAYIAMDNSIVLTELMPGTVYEVRVRQLCSSEEYSEWSNTLTFTTVSNNTPPSVTPPSASNITPTSATITSNVTADGGAMVTARGICWNTAHNPTINDSHTTDGAGIGTFNSLLSGLTPGTTYFVRAYATNSVGTTYGDEMSFTTTVFVDTTNTPSGDAQTCPGTPILTDIDNNVYNTVKIGDQCWMKENLRTTRFADGTSIPYSYDFDETTPYRCPADSNLEYVTTFGYLYNWKAAMRDECLSNTNPSGVQGVCPDGWHLPSQAEWHQLIHYVKNQASYTQSSDTNMIAKAMASQFGWVNSSYDLAVGNSPEANNQTGFTILPAGFYGIHTDVDSLYNFHFGKYTVLWSSSKKTEDRSHNCVLYVHADSSKIYDNLAGAGHAVYASVRCLRNNSETGNVSAVDIQNIRTILDTNHVNSTSAPVYGMVPSVSNADVDFYGICISTSPNPTVDGIHSTYYTNPILFGTTFTDLATNTTYYVRAYAQSCNSTFYGPEISFTTLPCDDYTTIVVHDTVNMDASLFLLYEDFETDGLPNGWSILDNDGDGHNWNHSGDNSNSSSHSGSGCIFSESYLNNVGPLTPDNYLITPALTIPANTPTTLSWYVMAQDSNWRAEHYEVWLSTSGTNASDFNQLLFESTISSSEYTHHEVDLSSYSGQTVHIAFVHNNCTDMFRLNLDDIFVYTGSQTYPVDYTEIQTGECISIVKHYVIIRPFSAGVNFSPAPEGNDATLDDTHQNNFTNQGTKRVNSSIPANSSAPEMNINAPHSSGNGAHSNELFSE